MSVIDTSRPVGDWVAQHPATACVFEELQIDYCCGGHRPLAEVCEAQGLDADLLASRLSDIIDQPDISGSF